MGKFHITAIICFLPLVLFSQSKDTFRKDTTLVIDTIQNTAITTSNANVTIKYKSFPVDFKEELNIDHCEIKNYCNFFPATFSKKVWFQHVKFDSLAGFGRVKFQDNAAFSSCKFMQFVSFYKSTFNNGFELVSMDKDTSELFDKLGFGDAVVNGQFNFDDVVCHAPADFERTEFYGNTYFLHPIFLKNASFQQARFQPLVQFIFCHFADEALFPQAVFDSAAKFYGTIFHLADFHSASFLNKTEFNEAKFDIFADLSNLTTTPATSMNFLNARLPHLLDFSNNAKLENEVNFSDADFDDSDTAQQSPFRKVFINLYKSDLSKIKIDYLHFTLCFYNSQQKDPYFLKAMKGGAFVLDGDSISYSDPMLVPRLLTHASMRRYLKQIFPMTRLSNPIIPLFIRYYLFHEGLPRTIPAEEVNSMVERQLKLFEQNGLRESHKILDIYYKDYQNGLFIIPGVWNCYGYHKEWIFLWTLGFLCIFTCITYFNIPVLNKPVAKGGIYHIPTIPATYNTFWKRVWYSFLYTSIVFFLLSLKTDNMNFKKTGIVYIIVLYALGILCLAYMANFVLQK